MTDQEILDILNKVAKRNGFDGLRNIKSLMHFICSNLVVSEEFIRQYRDVIPWRTVSTEQEWISTDLIREFRNELKWEYFGRYGKTTLTIDQSDQFKFYYPENKRSCDK